ncbi:MAG: lysozyme inhibitor LprI family protein [Pseudomonadota bacterium]
MIRRFLALLPSTARAVLLPSTARAVLLPSTARAVLLPSAALAVLLLAAPDARADEGADAGADSAFVSACLDVQLPRGAAVAEQRCVGLISAGCMNRPEGATTIGQSACLLREASAWELAMNRQYELLLARVTSHDVAASAGAAEALAKAQDAWAAYAEAECGYAYALWGDGSFRQVAGADCRLNVLARRAIQLRAQIGFES